MVLGTLGACLNAPELKEITWRSEMKKRSLYTTSAGVNAELFDRKIDDMDSRLSFASWVNRGNALFGKSS